MGQLLIFGISVLVAIGIGFLLIADPKSKRNPLAWLGLGIGFTLFNQPWIQQMVPPPPASLAFTEATILWVVVCTLVAFIVLSVPTAILDEIGKRMR